MIEHELGNWGTGKTLLKACFVNKFPQCEQGNNAK